MRAREPPYTQGEDDFLLFLMEFEAMKLSDFTRGESKYLRAADLDAGERVPLIVTMVKVEAITDRQTGKPQDRAVVYFRGWEQRHERLFNLGLVLNKCNTQVLVDGYGDSPEAVEGRRVILYRTTVSMGPDMVPALRLEIPRAEAKSTEATKTEDVPF